MKKIDVKNFSKRCFKFWKYYLSGLFKRFEEHHLFLSGGGIAFSLFLSVIPFILVVFALFNSIVRADIIELQMKQWIDAIIPYSEYSEYVKKALINRLPDFIAYKTWAGWLGIIGFIFSASTLFSGMRTILNRIFFIKSVRNAFIGLLRDMGMVIVLLFFVLLSTFVIPVYYYVAESTSNMKLWQYYNLSGLSDTLLQILSIAGIFLMFYFIYTIIPNKNPGNKIAALSAFWGTIFWVVSKGVFAYWAKNFISTNKIYGAFGLAIVVLFWVYFLSIIFISAAEIGQLYKESKMKPVPKQGNK